MIPNTSTNHVVRAQARFIQYFRRDEILEALLASYTNRIQDLEDLVWEVILERVLDDAVGIQLTYWGKIVGETRTNDDDDEYRRAIRVRIRVNRSLGLAEDLIAVTQMILPEDADFSYVEHSPATIRIEYKNTTEQDVTLVARLLRQTKAGGVLFRFLYNWQWESGFELVAFDKGFKATTDVDEAFTFKYTGTDETDGDIKGWSSVWDTDSGGKFIAVIDPTL